MFVKTSILMSESIKISQFSSLSFSDWKHPFERNDCYWQVFSKYDIIRVQLSVLNTANIRLQITNLNTGTSQEIALTQLGTEDDYNISYFQFSGLDTGCYLIEALNELEETILHSNFKIVERKDLQNTVRIRYTHYKDEFGVYFENGEEFNVFDFRVEGGFLYNEMQFKVSNNTFRDQGYNEHQLSALPYEITPLTAGTAKGVPIWVARKINLIFSLSFISVDGKMYVRSEGSEPEIVQIEGDKIPLYVIKINLEPFDFYNESEKEYPFIYYVLGTEDNKILGTEDLKGLFVENYNAYGNY